MTTIMPIDDPVPRGTIIGQRLGGPVPEAEHYFRCPLCGGWIDLRDRVWLDDHQGPLPHPACDQPQ